MSVITTPSELLEHLSHTDAEASTLDAVFGGCKDLAREELFAWINFVADYRAFSATRHKRWTGVGLAVSLLGANVLTVKELHDDDDHVIQFEHAFVDWHAKAKAKCGLDVPGVTPRDDPNTPGAQGAKTLEHILVAGAVIVTGIGLLVGFSYVKKFLP